MNAITESRTGRILLTGATGYVGGRLLSELIRHGYSVRCLARNPEWLRHRLGGLAEVVQGDVLQPETLPAALQEISTAYYLIHALSAPRGFEQEELRGARAFAAAARKSGVKRIIYLGGLGVGDDLSPHLRTRQQVGEILRESGATVIEFRAGMIIGSGSLSFEILRALAGRLPVMTTPKWTNTLTQPIAIEDILSYLIAAIEVKRDASEVFEIGSPDRMTYRDLLRLYAELRGLRRWIIPVPFLTPQISSLWLGLVTPVYARVGRKLIEGLRNETVADTGKALTEFPIRPIPVRHAMERAMIFEDQEFAQTRWSDAFSAGTVGWRKLKVHYGTRLVDLRHQKVSRAASEVFAVIRRIGGNNGWYYLDFLWRLRGWMDLLVGGVGLRRGRRHPENLEPGDTLDFWRVEAVEPDRLLRLSAEMRLPGRAWLQFEVKPAGNNSSEVFSTAIFDPEGLSGLLYWYALYPIHALIFRGMLRAIVRRAEASA